MKRVIHHFRRHFEERYAKPHGARAHLIAAIDGSLVSAILVLIGLGAYFSWFYDPLRDAFRLTLSVPDMISSPTETVLTVRAENIGKDVLRDVRIAVLHDDRFVPAVGGARTHEAEAASLQAGTSFELPVHGLIVGPPGEAALYVRMTAASPNGTADEKVVRFAVGWEENRFGLDWELPEAASGGQRITGSIEARNGSLLRFEDVRLAIDWPAGFAPFEIAPPSTNGEILLGPLGPGEAAVVRFSGVMGAPGSEPTAFKAKAFWTKDEARILMNETAGTVAQFTAGLSLEAAIEDEDGILRPGDTVPVTVRYRNGGAHVLKNIRLSLPLDPRLADERGSSVLFSPVPELPPGEGGEATALVRILSPVSVYAVNPTLALAPRAEFDLDEPRVRDALIVGAPAKARVSGEARLGAAARYFSSEGDQIGRGPLPPRAGATTSYWVIMSAGAGATALEDARVAASLPDDVRWTGRSAVTAGFALTSPDEGRTLVWDLGRLDPHAGNGSPAPSASFEVAITPVASSRSYPLVEEAVLTAYDVWSGLTIETSLPKVLSP